MEGGPTILQAFEQAALAMMGYMTELDCVSVDEDLTPLFGDVSAEDLESLLYTFLEEVLFLFSTEYARTTSLSLCVVIMLSLLLGSSYSKKLKLLISIRRPFVWFFVVLGRGGMSTNIHKEQR
eukprot:TRINITY_DN2732_c0_g1_i1.p1 TRINITY_DN2732_c0_g1~~TRINITY_DN2732_c0_g1_i1.p1  ORF type:complete len:123 (-),score=25.45 TRINITY_DN2732_c0_g1_i1:633-1001(-)